MNTQKPYYSLNEYYKETFGQKIYKLALNGGMSCPNRDGRLSYGGCIFCSEGGSGDFAASDMTWSAKLQSFVPDIPLQIASARQKLSSKLKNEASPKYIPYFQAYTNTYAPVEYLEYIFSEAIKGDDIVGLSVGTRPDCLEPEKIKLLSRLNMIKPVYVELGLQTIHKKTADLINRGYDLPVFEDAVNRLKEAGINVVVHTILGLPGESFEDMIATCEYVANTGANGIKLQLLHILKGTRLADIPCDVMTLEEYSHLVVTIIERLPSTIVIHRITGDGPKKLLIAPLWSADKKKVLNTITKEFTTRNTWQGKFYGCRK